MIERRDRACLLGEALQPLPVCGERCGQNLDGHRAVQPRIMRAVNFAHPAGTQRGPDFVGPEFCSGN